MLGAPSCTPSGWPFGPLRSNIQPGQYARNGILASLKQAVVPADSFEAYQQLTTSKKGSPCTSACGPITPSRLLQDIQAQNQAALAQVKHTLHSHTRYWPIQRPKQASPSQHWNWLEESNADVEVDVECCGESGAASKICSLVPGNSALFSRTSTVSVPTSVHSPLTSQLSLHPVCAPVRVTPNATHRSQVSILSPSVYPQWWYISVKQHVSDDNSGNAFMPALHHTPF